MKSKLRVELERLLQEGNEFGEIEKSPEAWERQTRHLIDKYLGPRKEPPTNAHSQGYYDFIFSDTHGAKAAVLKAILTSEKSNSEENHSNEEINKNNVHRRWFNFSTVKGVVEFIAAMVAIVGGVVAFATWLL
ncbi:MAG: hypothetical protein ABW201_08075 [Candidatus Thiodiazotropha sp.]